MGKKMKTFNGSALFLDRSDINTDEIIPAKYLSEISKDAFKPHLLEDLRLDGFHPLKDIEGKGVIISRSNFGCGSSREHAVWALEVNGINIVIAESYARIFKRNMFNCGMMAVELSKSRIDHIHKTFSGPGTILQTDFENSQFIFRNHGVNETVEFHISEFDRALVMAGGWLEYADKTY